MTRPDGTPEPPAEARLIRLARQAQGNKSPEWWAANSDVSIGPARWRHIEQGYSSPGKPVIAPHGTLAQIARALDLGPEDLAAAGRPEAAEILRQMQRDTAIEPVVVTQRLSELVRERRAELGLTLTETSARSLDPESGSTEPVWSVDELAELEADEDPRPPRIREIRALAGALALPMRVVQDATSVQYSGITVVWHPDMKKRVMVDGWETMTDRERAEVVQWLDRWGRPDSD